MFTLLFVVTDSYKKRKEQYSSCDDDETKGYLKRYHEFVEDVVSLISYSILKAGIIILLFVVYISFHGYYDNSEEMVVNKVINGILIVQLIQFVLIIIRILKEMYAMLYDDINK